MAEIVVVGAGLAGLAAAARLAKLGHHVTVCERSSAAGGGLRPIERDGYRWDAGAAATTLPAVLRDLFRKSGRPIERYVDLRLRDVARRHLFDDGTQVDLPTGSRGAQIAAVDAGLGAGTGAAWAGFVDGQAAVWESLRHDVLDRPDGGARLADRRLASSLGGRASLTKALDRSLPDQRLRAMAAFAAVLAGCPPGDAPPWLAVTTYVDRSFGVWDTPDGMGAVVDALVVRLSERRVDLRLECAVDGIVTRGGVVSGVRSDGSMLGADIVVSTLDPRVILNLPGAEIAPLADARRAFADAQAVHPPATTYLGLAPGAPALPPEVVIHGPTTLVVSTGGGAPDDGQAWTVQHYHGQRATRSTTAADPLALLAHHGIDVRAHVRARIDHSPDDIIRATGGAPYGFHWDGVRRHVRRSAAANPLPGLHLLGTAVHPSSTMLGGSIPFVGWGAAHLADAIGKP